MFRSASAAGRPGSSGPHRMRLCATCTQLPAGPDSGTKTSVKCTAAADRSVNGQQGGGTVVVEQAPTDHSVAIPQEKLAQYFKDMDARKLATLRMIEDWLREWEKEWFWLRSQCLKYGHDIGVIDPKYPRIWVGPWEFILGKADLKRPEIKATSVTVPARRCRSPCAGSPRRYGGLADERRQVLIATQSR